jgi:hypothetical protein
MSGASEFLVLAAAALLVVSLLLVARVFGPRSARSLFASYAKRRGMTLISSDRARLPDELPLLRKGDRRYAERLLEGPLGDGFEGRLADYTYVESEDGAEARYRFTIAYLMVPESVPVAPELFVRRKTGPAALEGLEDAFSGPRSRIKLESAVLDREYEIFASQLQDQNMIRQLFSPAFIVWLAEEAPPGLCFELFGGRLCCYFQGHAAGEDDLDRISAAAVTIATRLRDEGLEIGGR